MRTGLMLAGAGALIIAGLAMAAVGSAAVLEGIARADGPVGGGEALEVQAAIQGSEGVAAVSVTGGAAEGVMMEVAGEFGTVVERTRLGGDTMEVRFDAEEGATYVLTVTLDGGETHAEAAIGAVPDAGGVALGSAGLYAVIGGMAWLVGTGALTVWRHKRR